MAIAVPRRHEARVAGLQRARLGAATADAMQVSARRQALSRATDDALELVSTPHGLAEWCELAAANVDMNARCLLELAGQDARGACRTRAWILRNGARIAKGERGYAVSMFGGYVWSLRQTTGRFGSVGLAGDGDAPADVLDGYAEWATGDRIAAAILAAMRGYHVASVAESAVSVERLDAALARARGIAWNLPACLSCDGAGCLLCSCADDICRQAVVDSPPMAAPKTETPKRGRPPKVRPQIDDVAEAARRAAELRAEADRLRAEADELVRKAMVKAHRKHALEDIAKAAGVTRQRVHQIVNGRGR